MLRYANVGGEKVLPFAGGRGTCTCCGGNLLAKCGPIKVHHWAHERLSDCDAWSEPMCRWHLSWQELVASQFVEVAMGPHRADVVGNGGTVIELQHSSIGADDIAAREAYYGDMIWLFDATHRFASAASGSRAFFSLGQTKHLELCTKPVFLDFGVNVVRVEQLTSAVTLVSGFGSIHSRSAFARDFLSNVLKPGATPSERFVADGKRTSPWNNRHPVGTLRHTTNWRDPNSGQIVTVPKGTAFIKVDYFTYTRGNKQNRRWDHDKLIDSHSEIANGWTEEALRQMKEFLSGTAIILNGLLRLMPTSIKELRVAQTVSATEKLIQIAEEHINAGRIPVLKDSTKVELIEKARRHEVERYGRLFQSSGLPGRDVGESQARLFD